MAAVVQDCISRQRHAPRNGTRAVTRAPALSGATDETSRYLGIRSLLVPFLHHKELASDLEVLFGSL